MTAAMTTPAAAGASQTPFPDFCVSATSERVTTNTAAIRPASNRSGGTFMRRCSPGAVSLYESPNRRRTISVSTHSNQ